jgi:hypothetical protein
MQLTLGRCTLLDLIVLGRIQRHRILLTGRIRTVQLAPTQVRLLAHLARLKVIRALQLAQTLIETTIATLSHRSLLAVHARTRTLHMVLTQQLRVKCVVTLLHKDKKLRVSRTQELMLPQIPHHQGGCQKQMLPSAILLLCLFRADLLLETHFLSFGRRGLMADVHTMSIMSRRLQLGLAPRKRTSNGAGIVLERLSW